MYNPDYGRMEEAITRSHNGFLKTRDEQLNLVYQWVKGGRASLKQFKGLLEFIDALEEQSIRYDD